MSSEEEMRNVLVHAAEQLSKARNATITCATNHGSHNPREYILPRSALVSMAYAEAVMQMLASYLKVTDTPRIVEHQPTIKHQPTDEIAPPTPGRMVGRPIDAPRDEHGRFLKTGADPERAG